jgi:hypothetical protein
MAGRIAAWNFGFDEVARAHKPATNDVVGCR